MIKDLSINEKQANNRTSDKQDQNKNYDNKNNKDYVRGKNIENLTYISIPAIQNKINRKS